MSKVITMCVIILTVCALVLGNHHWKQKISSAQEKQEDSNTEETAAVKEEQPEWMAKAANLPAPIKEKMKLAKENGKPLKIVAVGSESTSVQSTGWPALLQTNLQEAYGEKMFTLQVLSYPEGTTRTFINENHGEEVNKLQPDILLFEPFSLNDNGNVGLTNTLQNFEEIIADFKEKNPKTVIYIQPSHPIFNATFYPKEVDALKELVKEKDLTYLNHWDNWPDQKDEKIKNLLIEDQAAPNDEGNKIWAEYLTKYFVKTAE
ncbi:SGNH/GDSL hydrolase family protein [Metabacillus idriensis]|uniref:SGNH/GDSL hydrolase family protein n=1 Tax=Metabacillus idriensis TaxID=324768 RepID=UPI00174C10E0|nr:SGNH/GDSL hydrolase family protein [Metabacillus idriensis]